MFSWASAPAEFKAIVSPWNRDDPARLSAQLRRTVPRRKNVLDVGMGSHGGRRLVIRNRGFRVQGAQSREAEVMPPTARSSVSQDSVPKGGSHVPGRECGLPAGHTLSAEQLWVRVTVLFAVGRERAALVRRGTDQKGERQTPLVRRPSPNHRGSPSSASPRPKHTRTPQRTPPGVYLEDRCL